MTSHLDLSKLKAKLEKRVSPKYRAFILAELPRIEAALAEHGNHNSPPAQEAIGSLTLVYANLNQQLGIICQEIGYQPKQWTWPDSKPLEILAQIFRGIEATEWYQRHLGAILQPVNHPWLKISLTSPTQSKQP